MYFNCSNIINFKKYLKQLIMFFYIHAFSYNLKNQLYKTIIFKKKLTLFNVFKLTYDE